MTRAARARTVRPSRAGIRAQTGALSTHRDAVVAQLRDELALPTVPAGRVALVMLMGYPGVGKTHCARLLATRLGAAHVATDHIRSRLFIAPSYTEDENAAVFGAARALVAALLRDGHTVVLDATHLRARHRAPAEEAASAAGAAVVHVLVTADEEDVRARLLRRSRARGEGDRSDADVAVYERMRDAGLEAPGGGYLEVRSGPHLLADIDQVVARVITA
jgi:predicted kinase